MGVDDDRRRGRADLLLLLVPVRGRRLLYQKRHEAGAILLGATALTGFIDWAPTKYLPDTGIWANLKMSQWLDEQYMWMSVATLVAFVWILYRFGYPPRPRPRRAGRGAVETERSAATRRAGPEGRRGRRSAAHAAGRRR